MNHEGYQIYNRNKTFHSVFFAGENQVNINISKQKIHSDYLNGLLSNINLKTGSVGKFPSDGAKAISSL